MRRPRTLTFEEGPLADWLARTLRPHVERVIVCDPRRNALIAKSGDKDDPIDAERLAQLLRGGYFGRPLELRLDRGLRPRRAKPAGLTGDSGGTLERAVHAQ